MRLLVVRFSALGDVTLLVPVIQELQRSHPKLSITVISQPFLSTLFRPLAVDFLAADLRGRHRGPIGMHRLARDLRRRYPGEKLQLIDQHSVLRSHILSNLFRLRGFPVSQLQKDRPARRKLSRSPPKQLQPLPHVTERYAATFARAGYALARRPNEHSSPAYTLDPPLAQWWEQHREKLNVGIAPFAQHRSKQWPREKWQQLWAPWRDRPGLKLWLFGGPDEQEKLRQLGREMLLPFEVVAGRFSLDQEIALMAQLHCLISMDSSNLHLGGLSGTAVISIWGGTHAAAGFHPMGPNNSRRVEIPQEELACRPCSIFGREDCPRGDFACLHGIAPAQVRQRLSELIPELS